MISDCSKFEHFDIQEEKHLYSIPNKVKRLKEIITPLYKKGCFTECQHLKIFPS